MGVLQQICCARLNRADVLSCNPGSMLTKEIKISELDDPQLNQYTSEDLKECLKDIKVLGKKEIRYKSVATDINKVVNQSEKTVFFSL